MLNWYHDCGSIDCGPPCFPPRFSLEPREHRRRIQFSRQFFQGFRQYFFRISLTGPQAFVRFKVGSVHCEVFPCFFKGSIFSCDRTLIALITAGLP
jgi:hypothetical protein